MNHRVPVLPVLALLAAAACAAPRSDEGERAAGAELHASMPVAAEGPPLPTTPESTAPSARAASAPAARATSPDGLTVWHDPAFQRQLAESYLAETDIEPRVTEEERESVQAILALIGKEELERALRELAGARGPDSNALYDFMAANVHFQREELDQAAEAYRIAVEKFPKFRRAWKNLALIRVRQSEFPEAREALARVLALGGVDALTYGLLGFAHANLGDAIAAESAYRVANLLDPATLDWKLGLARSFFDQKRYADAVTLCGRMLADDPERADLWLLQANAYLGLGETADAAENYEIVERLGCSTSDSLNMLADIYVNGGQYELAVGCYARALERDPATKPERALRAAKVMTAGGALAETEALVERIQALRGADLGPEERKDLLKLRARLALARGAGDEEARVLEEIVALDPLDGDALLLLGQHASRTGAPEQAVFYYERAASLERFEADARVRHAQLLVSQNRYGEALPLLRRAQMLKPREHVQQYLEQVERAAQGR